MVATSCVKRQLRMQVSVMRTYLFVTVSDFGGRDVQEGFSRNHHAGR
jgi:hypothetical protein